jgi:hypothetical protein
VLLFWRSSGTDDTQPQRFCGLSVRKVQETPRQARCAICVIVGKRLAAEEKQAAEVPGGARR